MVLSMSDRRCGLNGPIEAASAGMAEMAKAVAASQRKVFTVRLSQRSERQLVGSAREGEAPAGRSLFNQMVDNRRVGR